MIIFGKNKKFLIFLAFFIFGIVVSIQVRSTMNINSQKTTTEQLIARYEKQLDNEKIKGELLKEKVLSGEKTRDAYLEAAVNVSNDELLKKEWDRIRLMAGFTDVEGVGIEISLDDAPARSEGDPRLLIIHDADIRIILNELKKAGAQAISINGERIMPTSEQICAGPTIRINGNRYSVPYVIAAIGNPERLANGLTSSDRYLLMLDDGIRIDIKRAETIHIGKFTNNPGNLVSALEAVK